MKHLRLLALMGVLCGCSGVHQLPDAGSELEDAGVDVDAGYDAARADGGPRCDTPELLCDAFERTSDSFDCGLPCPFEGSDDSYHIYCRGWILGLNNCDWLDPSMFPDYCAGGCR